MLCYIDSEIIITFNGEFCLQIINLIIFFFTLRLLPVKENFLCRQVFKVSTITTLYYIIIHITNVSPKSYCKTFQGD